MLEIFRVVKIIINLCVFVVIVVSFTTTGVVVLIAASSLPEGFVENAPTFIVASGLVTLAVANYGLANMAWPDNE